jgi:NAD(P)-dependent dehydrogenase (short-subunit alcohol dehydrogenase family)
MSIAVYGATGRTGRAVLAELGQHGMAVVPISRRKPADADPTWREATPDDRTGLAHALQDAAAVVQCASLDKEAAAAVADTAIVLGIPYIDVCADQTVQAHLCNAGPGERARARGVPLCVGAAPIGGALAEWLAVDASAALGTSPERITLGYTSAGVPASRGSLRSSLGMLLGNAGGPNDVAQLDFPPPFGRRHGFAFPLGHAALDQRFPGIPVHSYAAVELGPVRSSQVAHAVVALRGLQGRAPAGLVGQLADGVAALAGGKDGLGGPLRFALTVSATGRTHTEHAAVVGEDPYGLTAAIARAVTHALLRQPQHAGVTGVADLLPARSALADFTRRGFLRCFDACPPAPHTS